MVIKVYVRNGPKMVKIIAIPKKAQRGRKKKINGAALLPMGKGGALFPL